MDDTVDMSSIHTALRGLASSLLLNLGFSGLAEKIDPMQRDAGAITEVLGLRSVAFTDAQCNFRSTAFSEATCHFRAAAFSDAVCNFVPQA